MLPPGARRRRPAPGAWFDLGLVHKWRHEWPEALECNRRAVALGTDEQQDAAYWNAGIAATALGDWDTARWAWAGFGIRLPDDFPSGEPAFGFGAVRLPSHEVVWGRRRDPARLSIASVPLPASGFRCGDVVLHDGAPNGFRVVDGREHPVFDVLERLEVSARPTVEVVVRTTDPAWIGDLAERLARADVVAENWTASITTYCKACSEGRLDVDDPGHDHGAETGDGTTTLGCSGGQHDVAAIVEAWATETRAVVDHVDVVA